MEMEKSRSAVPEGSFAPTVPAELVSQLFINLLREGYAIRCSAVGLSMSPFLKKGDLLMVQPIALEEAEIGEIVAFRRDESQSVLTTHRVIQKGKDRGRRYIITKGDRCRFRDLPIKCPSHVYGKVVSMEKNGRLISLETRFHRFLGYLIARFSLGAWYFRNAMRTPHLVPIKLMRRILRLSG